MPFKFELNPEKEIQVSLDRSVSNEVTNTPNDER